MLVCLNIQNATAAVIITLTATPGTCPGNGSVTANATGTSGTPLYSIKKSTASVYSAEQVSNVFSNLGSGTYTVKVHDASGETISDPVTFTNAAYTFISISNTTTGNAVVTGCDPDGSIDMDIAGGRPPFTYHLSGGPTPKPDVITSIRNVKFNQLATGVYTIDVTDACANNIVKTNIGVVSQYNLNGVVFGSLDGMSGALPTGGNCTDSISFSTNNILLTDIDGNVIFQRDVKHMPSSYPLQARVEYPAGSGIFTDWQSVFSKFNLVNYLPATNQYAVQVRNPCDPSNVVSSPSYPVAYPYQARSGFCAPSITRTTRNYICGPVDIHIVNKTNSSITRDYTWDGSGNAYSLDLTGLAAGSYAVFITTAGQTYQSLDISTATSAGVNVAATYNYLSTAGCDFATGGMRSFLSTFPSDNIIPITYTIDSGAAIRPPVTALQPLASIWNDLPAGTYKVRVDYGDCRTEIKPLITIAPPFAGFAADELSYVAGSSCGTYRITGKGWYLAPDSSISTSTTQDYAAKLFNAAGVAITGTGVSAVTVNNTPFTLGFQVSPGTYRVKLVNQLHSQLVCYYLEKVITIPPYIPVVIDISESGGVACGLGFGDVHVEAVGGTIHINPSGGSSRPLSYRIKPSGTTDDNYTAFQASPDFPNRPVGVYTAQIFDSCGYTTTQDIELKAQATSSSIEVTGANVVGAQGIACEHSMVSMKVNVIGTATNVTWTAPDNSQTAGDTYTIADFSSINAGKYYVSYSSGGCSRIDSVIFTYNAAPTYTFNPSPVICQSQSLDLATMISNVSPNSFAQFFINPLATLPLVNATVAPVANTSYFIRTTDTITGCKSTIGQIQITVNHPPLIGVVVAPPPICEGQTLEVTVPMVTEQGSPVINQGWLINGVLFNILAPLMATQNGIEVSYFAESGCGTTISPPVIVTVNDKPEFAFSDPDTVVAPNTVDLTTLVLASGDITGLTLTYYDSVYTPLSGTEISAAGAGTYYIIGTTSDGCSDTSVVTVAVDDVPLPVGLLYFTAEQNGNNALLKWGTSFEQNSNRFEIEQSTNGSNFVKIGSVTAAGNSSSTINYNHTDHDINRYGSNRIYYRLKQVDNDGRFVYSEIRLLRLGDITGNWKVYPIPFQTILVIDIPPGLGGSTQVSLTDMKGRIVYNKQQLIGNTQTNLVLSDLSALPNGSYILAFKNDKTIKSLKVVKE